VKELSDFAYTLDGDMLKEGYILACQSSLKSDITVELDKSQKAVEATKKSRLINY
jgi:ferredoxin